MDWDIVRRYRVGIVPVGVTIRLVVAVDSHACALMRGDRGTTCCVGGPSLCVAGVGWMPGRRCKRQLVLPPVVVVLERARVVARRKQMLRVLSR